MTSSYGKSPEFSRANLGVAISVVLCLVVAFWPYHKGTPSDNDVTAVAFGADGRWLMGGTRKGSILRWSVEDRRAVGSSYTGKSSGENAPAPFNAVALAPGAEFVAEAGKNLSLIAFASDKPAPIIWTPDAAFGGVAFSSDGHLLAAVSSKEKLLYWELGDSAKPRELGSADAGVYGATAFSPDGKRIVSAGHTLRLVDIATGDDVWSRPWDNYAYYAVAIRPDGNIIVTGSQDTTIRLWNAANGKELRILRGHHGYVEALAFNSDGKQIISWANDGELILWDLSGDNPSHRLLGITTGGAAFSPDGRWIASGGSGKKVLLWDGAPANRPASSIGNMASKNGSAADNRLGRIGKP
jgi:WD40 repeat protein